MRFTISLAIWQFIFCPFFGHTQEIEWQKVIGADLVDRLTDIEQTSDSGFILTGFSNSNTSIHKSEVGLGHEDIWIVKIDSLGNIEWENTIGGPASDISNTVIQTSDGGYLIGAISGSGITADKSTQNFGDYDFWIIKLDLNGVIEWDFSYGGDTTDYLNAIQKTVDGGYIVGGYSLSGVSGNKTESSFGNYDYWVIKTDSLGNIEWQKIFGGINDDKLVSIINTIDGGYVLGGHSNSSITGNKSEICRGSSDYWVIKISASGNIQWQKTIGGSAFEVFAGITTLNDFNYVIGGYSGSNISGEKTENCRGSDDYWIVKIDFFGNLLWGKTLGGQGWDELESVESTVDGKILLGGYSASSRSGEKISPVKGYIDYWPVMLDANGTMLWEETIGGIQGDFCTIALPTINNGILLGGYSKSLNSGDKSDDPISLDYDDFWITKLKTQPNVISGKTYIDQNSNGFLDSNEMKITFSKVFETTTDKMTFSNQNGLYNLTIYDTGNYITSAGALNYFNAVPFEHFSLFSGFSQIDTSKNFSFQPAGNFNDLCITITPIGNFHQGLNEQYMVNYENVGTTSLNPTITFYPDTNLTYISAIPSETWNYQDSVVWVLPLIVPYQTASILITVNVNQNTPIGTLINSPVLIEPIIGDINPNCNYSAWETYTTGSFDPNDIIVNRNNIPYSEMSTPPWLNYVVRFQNTGNDTAFYVRIGNNVDEFLNMNTFEIVSYSHPVELTYNPNPRLLEFTFNNIYLPDSNVNEAESHGFIRYRIKPISTLQIGDSIRNHADIYFDFNVPVTTNTVITEIIDPTSIVENNVGEIKWNIFPNPSNEQLNINFHLERDEIISVEIFNVYGQKINTLVEEKLPSGQFQRKFNIESLSNGVYFIQLSVGENKQIKMFVKIN